MERTKLFKKKVLHRVTSFIVKDLKRVNLNDAKDLSTGSMTNKPFVNNDISF